MHIMAFGSAREKAATNIQIIEVIKELKVGRPVTLEDQELLARYSGVESNVVLVGGTIVPRRVCQTAVNPARHGAARAMCARL
jgi:hypothetical protein